MIIIIIIIIQYQVEIELINDFKKMISVTVVIWYNKLNWKEN